MSCRYGFPRILYWLCSLARYSLNRLEQLSHFVWGWLRFIPARKRRVCLPYCLFLLIFLLVLGTKPSTVYAQEDTPTPTNYPIYVTPTPVSDSFECPEGDPVGWGTVTPSARWMVNCGQCASGTYYEWPTLDPNIWGTPVVTNTSEPIKQYSDVTVVNYYNASDGVPEGSLEPVHYEQINVQGRHLSFPSWVVRSASPGYYKISLRYEYHVQANNVWGTQIYMASTNGEAMPITVTFVEGEHQGEQVVINPNTNTTFTIASGPPGLWDGYFIIEVEVPQGKGANAWDFQFGARATTGFYDLITFKTDLWFQNSIWRGLDLPVDSYCSTVEETYPGDEEDEPFQLPGINVGVADCVTMVGITVPLDWTDTVFATGWEDWVLPDFEICFVPIDFGSLSIFGISVDLDLMALGMAGVVLIRLITRS